MLRIESTCMFTQQQVSLKTNNIQYDLRMIQSTPLLNSILPYHSSYCAGNLMSRDAIANSKYTIIILYTQKHEACNIIKPHPHKVF